MQLNEWIINGEIYRQQVSINKQRDMNQDRRRIFELAKPMILNIQGKVQIIEDYLKRAPGQADGKLKKILTMIKNQHPLHIDIQFDHTPEFKDAKRKCKGNEYLCHPDISSVLALFEPQRFKNILVITNEHVYEALKKLTKENIEICFQKVLLNALLICLSKHHIFMDVVKHNERVETIVKYQSNIDLQTITKHFPWVEKPVSQANGNDFESNLYLYKSKKDNPKDSFALWLKDPQHVVKQFESKINDEEAYGFMNYFNGYTKLALMVDFLVQEILEQRGEEKIKVQSLTQITERLYITRGIKKGSLPANEIEAIENGKLIERFGKFQNVNLISQNQTTSLKGTETFYYSEDSAFSGDCFATYNSKLMFDSDDIDVIEARTEDLQNYLQDNQVNKKCSQGFIKLLFLAYLVKLQNRKKTLDKEEKKKCKKFSRGFKEWLETGNLILLQKKEE